MKNQKWLKVNSATTWNHGFSFQSSNKQQETAMLKTNDIDFPLEVVMELRETYPDEVLESEWNPVIAKLYLQKREGWARAQRDNSHRLAIPEMDFPPVKNRY
jgi:hypothetical protein